ncbi:GTPase-activator protein for Ras family GTPase [Entamoeba histolytica HM-1:IMSS-B]|uniref:Ras-GAP domain-containing protein n=6 Tax=Entamoeba histolytica TaxID=5759 RepID=C4LY08_ENTH1|nr:hypothetical protein EHI_035810 [Entamoeba histolytica HM-1:IMSS]EMD45103.1 gtpaseactivator protein for Ras family gtpase [Entamoeba histolytica KU27]EMH74145.1 GTPase-activator protein for Ras family GTPase [Entamoeba histolytica HM-1:IMSS-B]EMS11180.1 GTPase-activator protein for Ras family GTPase [Entamoeba histolytica HM-3:IMSS]ENY62154.1 GTPase-activator protein for Ras family GTPase, putative [Entamoeba histolytica HM-1:IMSS-A]GAT93671.1 hypothetical protein CL6EHI_035810 [Entamoeba h|eukprot:XP_656155.1 hypothetical protein EHI_035810 [Entamoeba histolytica HM-1:IMSS]
MSDVFLPQVSKRDKRKNSIYSLNEQLLSDTSKTPDPYSTTPSQGTYRYSSTDILNFSVLPDDSYTVFTSSHRGNSKKSQEEEMRKFLFNFPSLLLNSYCNALIKNDGNPYHIKVLLEFYSSRGKLIDLLTNLAYDEIDSCNINNQIFRGNTLFTKIYAEYLRRYCSEFLASSTLQFIELLKSNKRYLDGFSLPKESEEYRSCFREGMRHYVKLVEQSKKLFPAHLREIIKNIFFKIKSNRGEQQAIRTISTLLYLRYLFIPFATYPSLLVEIQKVVNETTKRDHLILYSPVPREKQFCSEFIHFIERTLVSVITGPTSFSTSIRGISALNQEKSLVSLVSVIRQEMRVISKFYPNDFDEVFQVVKGKTNTNASCSVCYITDEFTGWMTEREKALVKENSEIIKQIQIIQKQNEKLRSQILSLKEKFI